MKNLVLIACASLVVFACTYSENKDLGKESLVTHQFYKDSLQKLLERQKAEEIRQNYLDSLHYEQEKKIAAFLDLEPSRKTEINFSDTIITYHYDFSFAGMISGKYIQIIKTDSSSYLTQVYYANDKKGGTKSFPFINSLTGEDMGNLYPDRFKCIKLSLEIWNTLISAFDNLNFLNLTEENCGRLVLDGTYSTIVFHCQSRTHKVERHHCYDKQFFNLFMSIDSLSPDPIPMWSF